MLDAGPAQPNQVDAPGTVSVEDLARGGDTRSAPPAECAASSITAAPGLQQLRSYDLRLLVSDRAAYFERAHDRRAGNSYPLASRRLPLLLALEIAFCGWEPVPDYLVRDRDRVYGEAFTRRIRAMGIIAPCCFVQQGLGAV